MTLNGVTTADARYLCGSCAYCFFFKIRKKIKFSKRALGEREPPTKRVQSGSEVWNCLKMNEYHNYRAAWNATRSYDEISVFRSVCLSVRLSNACIVTKRKKSQSRFLYHAIDNLV